MKKIITSLVSIVLLLGALCPVCAQEDNIEYLAGLEISNRTHFQSISDQDFKFPSSEEAIKVFRQGKKLLDTMERKITAAPPCAQLPSDLAAYKSYFSTVDYHEVVQSALVEKQNDQDLKHYRDFYNQIVWKEDGTPDLTKAATAKAYLAFYYLVHNQGKPSRLKVGRIDEHFPLLGVYADSFKELQEKFGNNDAYLWFTYQLYLGEGRQQMIPQEYDKKAEEIAKQMLYNDFKKYGFTENQVDQWIDFATSWNNYADFRKDKIKGAIQLVRDRGNCYSTIFIRPARDQYRTTLHEFQHVKDSFPGLTMGKNSLVELTTAIQNIIVSDIVYRRTHNKISDDQIVIYKYDDDPLGVKLGEIALFFRNLSEKYKTDNYAQLLLLPEATEYIENTYDKFLENVVFFIFKKEGIDPTLKSAEEIEMQKEYNKPLIRKGIEEGLQMKNQEVFGRP